MFLEIVVGECQTLLPQILLITHFLDEWVDIFDEMHDFLDEIY